MKALQGVIAVTQLQGSMSNKYIFSLLYRSKLLLRIIRSVTDNGEEVFVGPTEVTTLIRLTISAHERETGCEAGAETLLVTLRSELVDEQALRSLRN